MTGRLPGDSGGEILSDLPSEMLSDLPIDSLTDMPSYLPNDSASDLPSHLPSHNSSSAFGMIECLLLACSSRDGGWDDRLLRRDYYLSDSLRLLSHKVHAGA
jgi:hypothetical protein